MLRKLYVFFIALVRGMTQRYIARGAGCGAATHQRGHASAVLLVPSRSVRQMATVGDGLVCLASSPLPSVFDGDDGRFRCRPVSKPY